MSIDLNTNVKNMVLKILKLWMSGSREVISVVLNLPATISGARIVEGPLEKIYGQKKKAESYLGFPLDMDSKLDSNIFYVWKKTDLFVMIDLLIGGDGSNPMQEFDDMHMLAFLQAMKQIAKTLSDVLSENLGHPVEVKASKPRTGMDEILEADKYLAVQYKLGLGQLLNTTFEILLPVDLCNNLMNNVNHGGNETMSNTSRKGKSSYDSAPPIYRKAKFGSLTEDQERAENNNLDLILDIPLELTVVLGKTNINLRELLELKSGSIFSLEKLAGEPVELFVNDRFVGVGEVIVIDEHFGVRVIEVADNDNVSKIIAGGRKK